MSKVFLCKIQMRVFVLFFLVAFLILSSFFGLRLYFLSQQLSSENYTLNWKNHHMKTDLERIARYKQKIENLQLDWYPESIYTSEVKIMEIADLEKYIDAILESYHTSS